MSRKSQFLKRLDARWVINATLVALALCVAILTFDAGWRIYTHYRTAQQLVRANQLGDAILSATAITATERGMTATLLGMRPVSAVADTGLGVLRTTVDREWSTVQRQALGVSTQPDFLAALDKTRESWRDVLALRRRIDAGRAGDAPLPDINEWFDVMSTFINRMEHLRRSPFSAHGTLDEIGALNLSLRQWVWQAGEYAGMERGMLAYYVGASRPIPAATLDQLKAYRGVVMQSLAELSASPQYAALEPRLRRAIAAMDEEFFGRYDALRNRIYAAADTGRYAIDGAQFMHRATQAIGSILAVGNAVTTIANDMASDIETEGLWHMTRHLTLLGLCLLLAAFGLTKVRQTANALFREKELAEVTLHSIGDAVITTDAEARVEYLNPVAEELTGWRSCEAAGRPLREVFNIVNGFSREPDTNPVEEALREGRVVGLANNTILLSRDGREFTVEDSAAPIHDREGQVVGAVMVFYDVSTQRSGSTHLMSYYATHDALTGLTNRREFERRLSDLMTRAKRLGETHSLCYIDLDQFKVVNDTCGHTVGDKLLRQLTHLLNEHIRDADTLARLGGDEFGVLLENCPLGRAERIADNLRQVVRNFRFAWEGQIFELGSSIGLVPITPDSVSPAEVLAEADAACFAAKEKGRNRVQVYEPGDLELARRHGEMQWVSRIRQALQENHFVLHSQLITPLADGEAHHEVLLRLRDAEGKLVPPMSFIPAAERYSLMPDIDRWVISATLDALEHRGCASINSSQVFTINLSGASMGDADLLVYIREQLAAHHIAPQRICFEITETAAVSNLDQAAEFMKALKTDGCRFALDDFGSGLSSFRYLKTLPVDYLKIDGGFIRGILDDPTDLAMVDAINTIGHVMGIQTIAEFVENEAILTRLRQIKVDYAQGYGVERPRPLYECLSGSEAAN